MSRARALRPAQADQRPISVETCLALARPLLPTQVALAATDPRAPQPAPWPEEAEALSRARPERLREFAAGRTAARRAMSRLGVAPAAVLHGLDRAPIWPEGLVGSISHCSVACLAAAAQTAAFRAIGLDLEEDTPLELDLIPAVCTEAEELWLNTLPEAERGQLAKLIFSAKECAYKAQYPITGTLFGFQTLEVTLDRDAGSFEARFLHDVAPFAAESCLRGQYAIGAGIIVTAMALPA